MKKYDVFVIGSGMAGMTIANKCAASGMKTGITDELPYGGTCALRGCDPKKVIIGATEVVDFAQRLKGKGIDTIPLVHWSDVMAFKQSFVDAMPPNIEKAYQRNGVDTFHASARFIAANQLQVGDERVQADKIVVATGAKPRDLGIPGKEHALTSTDFLNLEKLPKTLLFIGGGYIAFEFAHIAARCGAKVTILHRGKRPLENFDAQIVGHLLKASIALGIDFIPGTEATSIKKHGHLFEVTGKQGKKEVAYFAKGVINSAGRPPAIFDLDLERGGIDFSEKGVEVNGFQQSISNPGVYAAGDAAKTQGIPLTPMAVLEGHTVASNLIKGNHKKTDYSTMPTVAFTLPAMASVGISEKEAKEKGLLVQVNYKDASGWFSAKRLHEAQYAYKTLVDKESNKILGAHLIGPMAEETINLFAMAIKTGMTALDLKTMVFAYPTLASDISSMV